VIPAIRRHYGHFHAILRIISPKWQLKLLPVPVLSAYFEFFELPLSSFLLENPFVTVQKFVAEQ